MKSSRLQILLIIGLLSLLGLLAFLQYSWQTQIAVAEKERLEKRLKTDAERFSEDFNKEISVVSIALQMDSNSWKNQDWNEFNQRYNAWFAEAKYPKLVKNIYYLPKDSQVLVYDFAKQIFTQTYWTQDLQAIFGDKNNPQETNFSLVSLVMENPMRIPFSKNFENKITITSSSTVREMPFEKIGNVIIELDENVIKEQILSDLSKTYFPDNDFYLQILNQKDETIIFQTVDLVGKPIDVSQPIFSSKPDNLAVFINRISEEKRGSRIVLNQKIERSSVSVPTEKPRTIEVIGKTNSHTLNIEKASEVEKNGRWTLNAQHKNGSLENFVNQTRNQNLLISFGILSLLAFSIGIVFVSTNRAKRFAQRQVDFVSSVSHEFRTPLAVIYSASENLTDGVVDSPENVAKYGNLIKREGKKLSVMVEQILEFAGANSGHKKYKFETINVSQVVENVILDNENLFAKENVIVEKNIAQNLSNIHADANALSHAIQNLITNSIKYSSDKKYLKISVESENNQINISVKDNGIGISNKDLKQIFEPFYRGKSVVDAQIHGNGLGLSLVKQIVAAHGGKVTVESELGKGSKFIIQLSVVKS